MDRFEEVKLRIKDGVDLVAFVEEYVPLKPRGRYHTGLCPFHQEKTPSFFVYADTQHYKCYGCGQVGDVFSFLMERDGLTFREAMESLADRLGLDTKGVFKGGSGGRPTADVSAALGTVRDWFRSQLDTAAGETARRYLAARGFCGAIDGFGLGFHPTGGRLRQFAQQEKLPVSVLEQAGLIGTDGYERFAGRLMFSIVDERGRVVGFGGRVLESDTDTDKAKYLNSPEAPFFNKRKLLFGLRQVKQAGERRLVVMEGYTDVIAAHLAGFTGAVATLGTALTTDHARLLERYATDGVVLLFDGDRAGRQAADRAFRELIHTRLPVRIALLDEGTDPADLVSAVPGLAATEVTAGRGRLQDILDRADDMLTVWFRLVRQRTDLTLDVNVERVTVECSRILNSVSDSVRREALGRRMAQHLGLVEQVFLRAVARHAPARQSPARQAPAKTREGNRRAAGAGYSESAQFGQLPEESVDVAPAELADAWDSARSPGSPGPGAGPDEAAGPLAETDLDLLACLLASPELLDRFGGVGVTVPDARELLELFRAGVRDGYDSNRQIVGYLFMRCAERPDLARLLAGCLDRSAHIKSPSESFSRLLDDRSAHASRHHAQHIRYQLQQARAQGDTVLVDRLTQEYLTELRGRSAAEG